jgi:outer membrane lipoprotein-sorting protein
MRVERFNARSIRPRHLVIMFRSTFLPLAPVVLAVAPAAAQTGDLAAVQAHLRALTTLTADFTQTDRNGRVLTGQLR